jgi:hypothetical protein
MKRNQLKFVAKSYLTGQLWNLQTVNRENPDDDDPPVVNPPPPKPGEGRIGNEI